jgi:hypothetical protein
MTSARPILALAFYKQTIARNRDVFSIEGVARHGYKSESLGK